MGPYTLRIPVKGSIGVCTGFYMRITVFRAYSLIGPYAPKDLLGFFKGIKALECVLGLKGVWGFEGLGCWLLWGSLGCFTGDIWFRALGFSFPRSQMQYSTGFRIPQGKASQVCQVFQILAPRSKH